MQAIWRTFDGEVPRPAPRQLGPNQAQIAEDVELLSGNLIPIPEPSVVQTVPADTISIYNWRDIWRTWTTDVDVVENPIAEDAYDRIHLTGDGTPKVYGYDSSTDTEYELDLGIPKPTLTPTATAIQKDAADITWVRTWHYQYEDNENTGTIYQPATLDETTDLVTVTPGKEWTLATLPAKVAGTPADARFVMWFSAVDQYGSDLGRVYPDISAYGNVKNTPGSSDLYVDGAYVTALQVTQIASPNATFTLEYDTNRASDYKVERAYVYTLQSIFGEEGPPSEPSVITGVDPSQNCTVANFDVAVTGNYEITHINVYRTVTDDNGHAAYQYVTQFVLGTASYSDELTDSATGEILQSTGWVAPPADMAGIVVHPCGAAVGFSGNDLYFSEPFYLHAYPVKYQQSVKDPIVAIGVTENSVIVATTKGIIVVNGNHPDSMSLTDGTLQQPCSKKLSMINMDGTIVYACPDGLVGYKGAQGALLTENYFREDQWRDLVAPTTLFAAVHDGTYYGWSSLRSLIFDFSEQQDALTRTTITPTAVYADRAADQLYLIVPNTEDDTTELQLWKGGTDNLRIRWKSRRFMLGKPEMPLYCRVDGDSYTESDSDESTDDVVLNMYAKGTLVQAIRMFDDEGRTVPDQRREKEWDFEVLSKTTIHEIAIAPSMKKLQQVSNE